MKKAIKKPQAQTKVRKTIKNSVKNGFMEAIGMASGTSDSLFNIGNYGNPLSQVDTLSANNRWYMISNQRSLLSEIYAENSLIQTVVNLPVDDALRGGFEIKTKQLSEEQIQELKKSLERDDDLTIMAQALKWNRLYGGAGVVIITDQDPETPLNISALTKDSKVEFRAVDLWELFWDKQNVEQTSLDLTPIESEFYSYYSQKLHKSRVLTMKGLTPPSFLRPRLRGWGFSIVEGFIKSVNQYLKSNNLAFELLDEFKLDIFKLKNLAATLLSSGGTDAVGRRVAMANYQKNYQNAITMDSEDDYVQKQLSFAGLAEVQEGIRAQIASDLRIPMNKLFGQSATGFGSGQDSIENYNAMCEGEIREKSKHHFLRLLEIKSQLLFQFIPDDLEIEFYPMRILSAEQEEAVKTQKFTRLLQAKQEGLIDDVEFRTACNHDNLLEIQLEVENVIATSAPTEIKTGIEVTEDKGIENSYESTPYLKKAYEMAGGDRWENPHRLELILEVTHDPSLWAQAKAESIKAFGQENKAFTAWMYYKRLGGK